MGRVALRLAASLALLTFASPALPQAAADPAAARALFEEGTKALDKGDWDGACPKFDASYAMKPTVSALLNIAKCHDHGGKLTAAADDYQRALSLNEDTASQSRKKELAEYATEALKALQPRIPKLRIVARDPPADLRVTRDGAALPLTALGVAIPMDPGEHVIVASAAGRRSQTMRVVLVERAQEEVRIDLFADDAVTPPPPAAALPVAPPPRPVEAFAAPVSRGAPAWAWVAGATGLALGGVAIYFAVDGAGANCGGPCKTPQFTQAEVDTLNARRHRDLAGGIALGAAGAIGIAVGAWGIASAPRAPTTAITAHPILARDQAGIALRGGF